MSRAGGPLAKPGASTTGIPQSAKKVIQLVKEAVPGWDDDQIYSALKECGMDPNEAVQRLVTAEPYKEVKRKKEKKKEEGKPQVMESRTRPTGPGAGRGGRGGGFERGSGRGSQSVRPSGFQAVAPGLGNAPRAAASRENGLHPRAPVPAQYAASASQGYVAQKAVAPGQSALAMSPPLAGGGLPVQFNPSTLSSSSASPASAAVSAASALGTSEQRPYHPRGPQGSWGSSQTLADIVKANGPPPSQQQHSVPPPAAAPQSPPQYDPSSISVAVSSPPSSSGLYASAADPVLHPSLDARAPGGAAKRELGSVQRPISKDRAPTSILSDISGLPSTSLQAPSASQGPSSPPMRAMASPSGASLEAPQIPTPLSQELQGQEQEVGEAPEQITQQQQHGQQSSLAQRPLVGNQYGQGTGLEWKAKPAAASSSMGLPSTIGSSSGRPLSPPAAASDQVPSATSKLQELTLQEEKPVILPGHLQLSEADKNRLSFGSFGAGFGSQFGSYGAGSEGASATAVSKVESARTTSPPKQSVGSGSTSSQGYSHPPASSAVNVVSGVSSAMQDVNVASALQPEQSKHETTMQTGPQFPYHAMHTYPGGYGLMPAQVPSTQYANYDPADGQSSHGADASRTANVAAGMPYGDVGSNYYSQAFRPSSETDSKYSGLAGSAGSSKYGGSSGQGAVNQTLQQTQEGGGSASGTSHSSQASGVVHSMPTMLPQQMLHPFGHPAGMPPGGPYSMAYYHPAYGPSAYYQMQQAYNHPYGPTGASAYAQGPAGSSYPPGAGSGYPPGVAAGPGKFPMVPPYGNPKSGATGAPNSGAGGAYGGYAGGPSGYGQPAVSSSNATGFEDISVGQYKDSNLYIPGQQGQLSRDMSGGGMGGSSYYNIPGQAQHAYGQAHLAGPHHAYSASMYGQSQPPQQVGHQGLQPSQQGTGAAPQGAGGYQQSQRGGHQSWTPNY